MKRYPRSTRLLFGSMLIWLMAMLAYLAARLSTFDLRGFTSAGLIIASALIGAELFVAVHGLGYLASMMKALRQRARHHPPMLAPFATAPVAVLVASFNESEEVLEETLASVSAMDYANFHIYLLDDSTRKENQQLARRLAERYRARLMTRAHRAGYKAGAINDVLPRLTETYVAILDADQRPSHSWLREIVPQLDADPELAFVQAPQVYVNHAGKPVARAAYFQQAVFYEYICEGKSSANAMFCCGSNVVIRREALLSIGADVNGRRHYFDETSITEDFATSVRLHAKGWRSRYVNRTYVVGMGPETLAAYFTQQTRWAMGNVGVFRTLVRSLLTRPGTLTAAQWWEYLLSSNYYFVGFMNFIFMLASFGFLLFGVRPVRTDALFFLALFVPYFAFSLGVVLVGMKLRHYPVRGVWIGTALAFGAWWTYAKAAVSAALTTKQTFSVTPKGAGGSVALTRLIPEAIVFGLCCAALVSGVIHILFTPRPEPAYYITSGWMAYDALLLGMLFFHFNRPVTIDRREPVFHRMEPSCPRSLTSGR